MSNGVQHFSSPLLTPFCYVKGTVRNPPYPSLFPLAQILENLKKAFS